MQLKPCGRHSRSSTLLPRCSSVPCGVDTSRNCTGLYSVNTFRNIKGKWQGYWSEAKPSIMMFSPISKLFRWGSSTVNSQQRVAIIGSLPLLDGNWWTQGTRKQSRTTEIGPSFFIMMYISFAAKIHRSTITTVARPQLAGSVTPVTRAKQHYITGCIQWHYAAYRSTDYTFLFLFFFFALEFACLIDWENPPNKCAKMIRQINAPKWPAKIFCHGNLPGE